MRILFFSDVHGIKDNLKYIKKLEETNSFDKIVVLGDLYYPGPTYNKEMKVDSLYVKDFLQKYSSKLICIKGNCDSDVDIKASDFPICTSLSLIVVDNIDIYLTHGNEYSIDKNRKFDRKGVLVYGHEHIPYIKKEKDMVYVNVGSISLPKDECGPTYAIYENKKITIYNINSEVIDYVKID